MTPAETSAAFQRLTGGLGGGAALTATPCGRDFDPRLASACSLADRLVPAAILNLFCSGRFLIDIAAPALLHLPFHHCPYDLVPKVPEALLMVGLFLAATFAVGWAGVVAWGGQSAETRPFAQPVVTRLLWLAGWSYLGSLVMMSLELALA